METDKRFPCEACGRAFRLKGDLNRHMMIHTGIRPYKCDYCDKTFIQKSNLTQHKKSHTGGAPYECDIRKKTFSSSGGLAQHKIIHSDNLMKESEETDPTYGDCGETIKVESMKEEIKEVGSVDHYLLDYLEARDTYILSIGTNGEEIKKEISIEDY